jgi:hypothetical protein
MSTISRIVLFVILILVIVGIIVGVNYLQKEDNTTDIATPVLSVAAFNKTKNQTATAVTANPSDEIVFTLTAENQTDTVIPAYVMQTNISQVANVATLTQASGASFDSVNNNLVWTPLDIAPHSKIEKLFSVRVSPVNANSSATMKVTFNNEIAIFIANAPVTSGTSNQTSTPTKNNPYKAPATGPVENYSLWAAVIVTLAVFGIRKYKLAK